MSVACLDSDLTARLLRKLGRSHLRQLIKQYPQYPELKGVLKDCEEAELRLSGGAN